MDPSALSPKCTVVHSHETSCATCTKSEGVESPLTQGEELVAKSERTTFKSAVDSNDSTVSKLPFEIASRIFDIYVVRSSNQEKPNEDFTHYRMTSAPLRLGAVCRSWRTIAWSSPRIWTILSINIKRKGNKTIAELTQQWLKRSGALPLLVCLYQTGDSNWPYLNDDEESSYLSTLMGAVHSESYRWESFDFRLHFHRLADVGLPTGVETYQNLSALTASFSSHSSTKDFLNRLTLPSLKRVWLIGRSDDVAIKGLISLITRSSCRLTELLLDMEFELCEEIYDLLQVTPTMKTLDISFCDVNELAEFMRVFAITKFESSESSPFLPNLEIFRTTVNDSHCFSWESILCEFEPSSFDQDGNEVELDYIHAFRPFKLEYRLQEHEMKDLDKDTLHGFTDLIARGLNISIDYYGEDVIAKSLALHFPHDEVL